MTSPVEWQCHGFFFIMTVSRDRSISDDGNGGVPACRKVGDGRYAATTREIRFTLDHVAADGTYTLRVALAAAQMSRLQVRVNGRGGGAVELTTPEFGGGNAIARHGIHGVEWSFEFPIRGYMLQQGENSVSITQTRAAGEFLGVLYDYLRLEAPPGSGRDPTAAAAATTARRA